MSARRLAAVAALFALAACGSDYRPPDLPLTGAPAGPLGQVVDAEVDLPHLLALDAGRRGVALDLRIEIERVGFGRLPARVIVERAHTPAGSRTVEDLSDGTISVIVGPRRWTTTLIGPLRIGTTLFDLLLDGEHAGDAWVVEGRAFESQSALEGSFRAWRRHRFLVAGTDFFSPIGQVSEVAWVKRRELRVRPALQVTSSDPVLRVTGGAVFAVNRLSFDNLQRLDPFADFGTVWQQSVGRGANPHDLAFADGLLWVTRYEPPFDDLALLDPGRGTLVEQLSLDGLAENPDGTPRADRLRLAEGMLFVALQDIDRSFTTFGEGKLAVIDPVQRVVAGVIPLGGKNPGSIELFAGADGRTRLYVALAGIFPGSQQQELSGGVVVVDALARAVERLALDDDDVGGNVGALALASESLGYVAVSDAAFTGRVVAFDPRSGEPLRQLGEASVDLLSELEVDSAGVLAVPDRSFLAPRLCLYETPLDEGGVERPLGCAPLPLPPFSLEALD